MSNIFPSFFKDVKTIRTYDELALVLGSVEDGIIEYSYEEIVKIAGHSCPTIAGAYLFTCKALKALYKDELPRRGEIKVEFKDSLENGVTGVISNVISNITGATDKSGFKGLNATYARHSLMSFNKDIKGFVKFSRVDTKESVELVYNPNIVPLSARGQELMKKVLSHNAEKEEIKEFGKLWQERVKKILIDNYDNIELVKTV